MMVHAVAHEVQVLRAKVYHRGIVFAGQVDGFQATLNLVTYTE